MNAYEEELQKKLEDGQRQDHEDLDVKAYHEVFRALRKDPGYKLSPEFASKVVAKVAARHKLEQSREYLWFLAGVMLIVITAVVTIILMGFRPDFGLFEEMGQYKGLAAFAVVFVIFLNWLDKRLVRKRLTHH